MSESDVMTCVHNAFPFSCGLITSNFSLVLIVFRRFFTWTALGDVD